MESGLATEWQDAAGLDKPVELYLDIYIWLGSQEKNKRVQEGLRESVSPESHQASAKKGPVSWSAWCQAPTREGQVTWGRDGQLDGGKERN